MLKSMPKSKNRYFYHIFVSPGDAPGAITLNIIWMDREIDAYNCLAECAHITITVSQIKRDIGQKCHFVIPLAFDAPVRGVPVRMASPRLVRKN